MATWNRHQWASAVSCIHKKWMGTVEINQRLFDHWHILGESSYKSLQYGFLFSFILSLLWSCVPLYSAMSSSSSLDTSDFYKHSPFWGIKEGDKNWLELIIWTAKKFTILKQFHLWKSKAIPGGPWGLCGFVGRPDQSFSVVWGLLPPGASHMYRHSL